LKFTIQGRLDDILTPCEIFAVVKVEALFDVEVGEKETDTMIFGVTYAQNSMEEAIHPEADTNRIELDAKYILYD
jgi:hypothetical protein